MAADGITINAEREELVDFSVPYVTLVQRLLVRTGEDRFATPEEFAAGEFTIGVQPGTTNFFTAEALLGEGSARILAFDTFPIAVQAMLAGDIDAVVMDDVAGQGYVGVNPESLQMLPVTLTSAEALGFIFPSGSTLTDAFNLALAEMKIEGTLMTLNNKWFSGE